MHPYIPHLLQDIKNAERKKGDNYGHPEPTTFEEEMEEIERYISGEGERSLSYFTGLKKEHFPPADQLSESDMEEVLKTFDKMLSTWRADISFPDNMPTVARYVFLLEHVLEDVFMPVSSGYITFDYCTGSAPDCVWGEYCPCLDIWNR